MKRLVIVLAAILMIVGGFSLLFPLTIDYVAQRAYTLVFFLQALGFVMIFGASLLALKILIQTLARVAFVLGSALWVLCWAGFLIGYFVPIPLAFWASLASATYLVGAVDCFVRHEWTVAVFTSVFAVSSICSTLVMLLAAASLISPDYSYAPFALGAVVGGVLLLTSRWPHRPLEADRRVSAAAPTFAPPLPREGHGPST